jgi:hypothetical protein
VSSALWATLRHAALGVGQAPTLGNGRVQIGSTGETKAEGLAFHTDTFLYRDAANSIKTDGAFTSLAVKLTPEGGIATLLVADEAIAVGHTVCFIQGGTANRVKKTPISGNENDMPIGVAYSASNAAGDSIWVVVSGRVGVLPDTGVTAAQGYVITTSATTAGLVAQAATAPAAATHFKEVGHFCTTGSGAGVITDAIVHFN